MAQTPPMGWPEAIGLLAKARTQAITCVQVLKSSGDKPSVARAQLTYGMAEAEMDGVIAGLTTAPSKAAIRAACPPLKPVLRRRVRA
jgi:hypothetical protein